MNEDSNIVELPEGVGLLSDIDILREGRYAKVKFPVSAEHEDSLRSENMWAIIKSGDTCNGTGTIDNNPMYSDFAYGQLIRYEEIDGEVVYVETLAPLPKGGGA